jgi:hypothetical protein
VTSLRLAPHEVVLAPGEQVQFRILVKWSDGATIVPALEWSVEDGTISPRGLYTAGQSNGAFRVIARPEAGGAADTATVTVRTTAAPPPGLPLAKTPPASSITRDKGKNEPEGYAAIAGRRFDSKASGPDDRGKGTGPFKSTGSEGWDDVEARYRNVILASDPKAPLSPPGILRFLYQPSTVPAGRTYTPGTSQTLGIHSSRAYGGRSDRKLYLRMAFRVSENWQGHPTSTNKLVFVRANGAIHMEPIIRLRGAGNGPLILNIDLQGSPRDPRTDTGGLNPNTAGARQAGAFNVQRGQWYVLEAVFEVGTNGGRNGKLRMYLDGVLTHEYNDIEFEPSPKVRNYWEQIHIDPTWGGQGGRINELMWLDFDDVFVSGAP